MKLFTIHDKEFSEYGKVILHNFDEIIMAAEKIHLPEESSVYVPSEETFETLSVKDFLENEVFGETKTQIGYCYGHAESLNAFEWHKSTEVNIAVTDAILFLGNLKDVHNNKYDTKNAKAFLIKKGEAIEIFSSTLHFCPCEVTDKGFGMIVVLPYGTNTPLEKAPVDTTLFRKNKWILAHTENISLIERGVVPGVYGKNYNVKKDLLQRKANKK